MKNFGLKLAAVGLVLIIASRLAAALLVLGLKVAGIALIVWGGYKAFQAFSNNDPPTT